MPLKYRAEKIVLPQLNALAEAKTWDDAKPILTDLLQLLSDATTSEFKRVSTSVNGGAGEKAGIRAITGSTFVSSTDGTILADTTAGDIDLTLPKASQYAGMRVCVKKTGGANALTVKRASGDTIDGAASDAAVTTTTWFHCRAGTNDWQTI